MLANRSIPSVTVIPELAYADVSQAVAWLRAAFGFAERLRIGNHRVQLTYGAGAVVARDGGSAPRDAPSAAAADHSIMVRVEDADAHHARAVAAGARILQPPTDHPFGERQYSALDIGGHAWTFTQSIADVDPASWGGELVADPGVGAS